METNQHYDALTDIELLALLNKNRGQFNAIKEMGLSNPNYQTIMEERQKLVKAINIKLQHLNLGIYQKPETAATMGKN